MAGPGYVSYSADPVRWIACCWMHCHPELLPSCPMSSDNGNFLVPNVGLAVACLHLWMKNTRPYLVLPYRQQSPSMRTAGLAHLLCPSIAPEAPRSIPSSSFVSFVYNSWSIFPNMSSRFLLSLYLKFPYVVDIYRTKSLMRSRVRSCLESKTS